MKLRDYRTEDYPSVAELWNETGLGGAHRGDGPEVIARTLTQDGKFLILEDETTGEIVGTSWMTNDGRRLHLHHIGVRPKHQGQGYGKLLTEASVAHARAVGLQIKLEVHRDNTKAISIYVEAGFKALGPYDVYIHRNTGRDTGHQ